MIIGEGNKKPNIEYPCKWTFKVIGNDLEKMIAAMEEVSTGFEYEITSSNISKKGNYFSMNLIVLLNSDTERISIYNLLSERPCIKYIL
ncbi:MAG: DUF493 domain-containing protein [Melioribacteraceae bacterium]|jgi:putative lipoic acid-binding regulatory protein|nr:DUF493 domain-containing protein [Melioribacteraceae bacterium]